MPWYPNDPSSDLFKEQKRKKTVYVENLNKHFTQNDIYLIFKRIGEVKSIDLNKKHKGNCFVEFASVEEAEKALELDNKIPEVLMDISKGRISALTVMSYAKWRNFKDELIKLIEDTNL